MKIIKLSVLALAVTLAPAALAQGKKAPKPAAKATPAAKVAPGAKAAATRTKKRVVRRSQRHSAEQSKIQRQVIKEVKVTGRAPIPGAVFDISRASVRFESGTAKYSPNNRRFLKKSRRY